MSGEASDIIERVRHAYATCMSYRDEGVVVIRRFGAKPSARRYLFSTVFDRERGFRFVCQHRYFKGDPWNTNGVWTENGKVMIWESERREVKESPAIREALRSLTAKSSMACIRIPALLMPEALGAPIAWAFDSSELRLVRQPDLDGHVVVRCERGKGIAAEHVWIDPLTQVIRRVVMPRGELVVPPLAEQEHKRWTETGDYSKPTAKDGAVELECEHVFTASMNIPIDEADLRFDPYDA